MRCRNRTKNSPMNNVKISTTYLICLIILCMCVSYEELTHWKRLWCWEGLGARGEGDDRGWDGWMASLTQWTWVWVNSGSWWWTGKPGVLRFMRSQRVGHDWATDLIWSDLMCILLIAYNEWCWIHDLWRRFSFGTRDQAWSLKSFCAAEFY